MTNQINDSNQYTQIDNRQYRTILVRNHPHIRVAANVPLENAEQFIKKCQFLKRDKSLILNMLIQEFNLTTGWMDERIKSIGDLFEYRAEEHAKVAGQQFGEKIKRLYQ